MDSSFWFETKKTWDSPLYMSWMSGYNFFKHIVFSCLKTFSTFINSIVHDEMQHYAAFYPGIHWLYSVDPDEMQHHAAFHLGLHCL